MKGLLTLFSCILFELSFGQFAIVADKDGFVNVRKSADITSSIIDTLWNGQIVYCFETEGEWRPTDYDLSRENKHGYVHGSRVKFIDEFDNIGYEVLTDSTLAFKKDSIKLVITKTPFQAENHRLDYHTGNAAKNEMSWLEKINGKEIWGTDGNVPKNQYGQITLTIGKDKIFLPFDNLFEPHLEFTKVHIDWKNKTVYISAINSDGAGGYAVLWIVEDGKFKERITTVPF
jgi:hypothetical protein